MLRHDASRGLYTQRVKLHGRQRGSSPLLVKQPLPFRNNPQHDEFEAEIIVCEISQYLSTKTSSSVRFFYNMELWKLCFLLENWVKMKSIVIMFPLKRSSKSKIFQHHPLPLFLRFALLWQIYQVPLWWRRRGIGSCHERTTCNMILIICVFLSLGNLKLTRKYVTF